MNEVLLAIGDVAEILLTLTYVIVLISIAGSLSTWVRAHAPVPTLSVRRSTPGDRATLAVDLDLDHRRREVLLAAQVLADAMDGGEPGPEADLHDEIIGVCETVDRLRAVMPR